MPKMRLYYNMSQNFLAFNIPHNGLFFMFGVSNVKYLALGYLALGILDGLFANNLGTSISDFILSSR